MKSLSVIAVVLMAAFILAPVTVNAQTGQAATVTSPLSQPLVREGTLAARFADVLKVGPAADEFEAESALSAVGISPGNGWIADYPVTPDIAGELETSISDAAEAGRIPVSKDAALKTFQDVMAEYNLPVASGSSVRDADASAPDYPDTGALDNYYDTEGPPVVTYYAPPPDYAYMYDWVPSPFWWSGLGFSGFFVLTDFDVRVRRHGHKRGDGHDEFISNHFHDAGTGRTARIDPSTRTHGRAPAAIGMQGAPSLRTHSRGTSGSTCSSCHYSAPSGSSRSSGFPGGSNKGSLSGPVHGSPGGGWRR